MSVHFSRSISFPHVDAENCSKLWAAVMAQMVRDSTYPAVSPAERRVSSHKRELDLAARQARWALLDPDPELCLLAGIDREALVQWAQAQDAIGWSERFSAKHITRSEWRYGNEV